VAHYYSYTIKEIGELGVSEFFNLRNDIIDVYEFFHPSENKSDGCLTKQEFENKARMVQSEIDKRKKG